VQKTQSIGRRFEELRMANINIPELVPADQLPMAGLKPSGMALQSWQGLPEKHARVHELECKVGLTFSTIFSSIFIFGFVLNVELEYKAGTTFSITFISTFVFLSRF
jgi:hypothetical protein